MIVISKKLQEQAKSVLDEIYNSTSEFYRPVTIKHKIFETAYLKFVNRNLNYFYFESMVAQTTENNEFSPEFPTTLKFCNFSRELTSTYTPFGRMCIWYVPPNCRILPHRDNYTYHKHITRNVFVLTENIENKHKIYVEGKLVESFSGLYFQFDPYKEQHSFVNLSENPFIFLSYDFWIKEKLEAALESINLEKIINDPIRLSGFGAQNTLYKYISTH